MRHLPYTSAMATPPNTASTPASTLALRRAFPYLLLVMTNLFWAGNWVTARAVRESFHPFALTFWRWFIAVLVMAPFVLPGMLRNWPVIRVVLVRRWPLLTALSFLGVMLFQCFVYLGLQHTTAINGVLLNSTMPISMILVAWAIDRETVSARQVVGVLVSLVGIVEIVTRGELSRWASIEFNVGDAWILAAMPVWAVYSVLLRRRPPELPGMQLVFVVAVMALPLMGAAYAIEAQVLPLATPSWPAVAGVLYVALFASVAAFACWNAAVAMVGPNVAGFSIHLLPAFGAVLAMLFLGERPEWFHLWGVIAILIGVGLATLNARRA